MRGAKKDGLEQQYEPTLEESAELDASIAEIERGEHVTADEVIRELRAMRDEELARRS